MKRLGIALTIAMSLGLFLAAPALAYPVPNPGGDVGNHNPHPGETITVFGDNWCPDSTVTILFDGHVIGHVHTDSDGAFSTEITIPDNASPGHHVITLTGLASDCQTPKTVTIPITVVGEGGGVAFTGADISRGMLLAGILVIVGAGALIVGRRRKVGAIK